jgi:hypothetical protein
MAKKLEEKPKTMYDRLRELKFFCPDDEAGEMFQTTCRLAYQMSIFGDCTKAETLYEWAKEQARSSRIWCEENGYDINDFITGTAAI